MQYQHAHRKRQIVRVLLYLWVAARGGVKVYISSRENPGIKKLVRLMTSKKARNEYGEFAIEGARNCLDAAAESLCGRLELTALYYTEKALQKYSCAMSAHRFEELDDSIKFEISPELADKISQSENGQGVFAIAKKLDKMLCADTIDVKGKYVVLDGLQDPGNVGTVIRTCDAVGASGVVLTGDCCDIYNPKVVRSAMGSMARVDMFIENDFCKVADMFRSSGIVNIASVIENGQDIRKAGFDRPCALYIGNEGSGMPKEHIACCDEAVTISMQGRINSLNAAAAAAIMLWEMFR